MTDFRSSDLSAIDLCGGATRSIALPGDNCCEPHGIDISEDGRTLYVACAGGAWCGCGLLQGCDARARLA